MARRTTVRINLVRDARAISNACYKCSEVGHFQRNCKYDGDVIGWLSYEKFYGTPGHTDLKDAK